MALIKCTECGQEISDMATACPKCGKSIDVQLKTKPKLKVPIYFWQVITVILVGCAIVLSAFHLLVSPISKEIANAMSLGVSPDKIQVVLQELSVILQLLSFVFMVILTPLGIYFAFKELRLKTFAKNSATKKFLIWKMLLNYQGLIVQIDKILDEYNRNNPDQRIKSVEDLGFLLYELLKEKTVCKRGDYFSAVENPTDSPS